MIDSDDRNTLSLCEVSAGCGSVALIECCFGIKVRSTLVRNSRAFVAAKAISGCLSANTGGLDIPRSRFASFVFAGISVSDIPSDILYAETCISSDHESMKHICHHTLRRISLSKGVILAKCEPPQWSFMETVTLTKTPAKNHAHLIVVAGVTSITGR